MTEGFVRKRRKHETGKWRYLDEAYEIYESQGLNAKGTDTLTVALIDIAESLRQIVQCLNYLNETVETK